MDNNATREVHSSQSSVEISINAKGHYSAKVKVYADTVEEALSLADAKATILETTIRSKNIVV